ncbi:hypothetical protein OQA88_2327 [Cercophora sp. LCS_1]
MSSDSSPSDPARATVGDDTRKDGVKTKQVQMGLVDPNGVQEVTKKKRKNRPKGQVKKRGTGFEEYFCDAPMTPAQYAEEQALYPSHRPFVDRIEECIQRFRTTRRLDGEQQRIFSHYLMLGGVDATQRQFSGSSKMKSSQLDDRTKSELREATADDVIQRGGGPNRDARFYNPDFPEHWRVDFSGVVAGFLSDHIFQLTPLNPRGIDQVVCVVSNFLKYVDRHDVCPEYAADLRKAQELCKRAAKELPLIPELLDALPGSFHQAASTLFCEKAENTFDFDSGVVQMDGETARTMFTSHVALLFELDQAKEIAETMKRKKLLVVETMEQNYEVVDVSLPNDKIVTRCKQAKQHLGKKYNLEACGSLVVRKTVIEDGFDNPATEGAYGSPPSQETFFFEQSILENITIGMKITLEVCVTNVGFKFIKSVSTIRPSFYTFLPQELMLRYKMPAKDNRPAPSVFDPYADPDVLDDIPFGDPEDYNKNDDDDADLQGEGA